jgi:hypothetical protein
MQKFYADAFFCRPPSVLNVQLLPCTLGHIYFLQAIESAFFKGTPVGIDDLVTAVWVCSRPFAQSVSEWQSGKLFESAKEIGQRMGEYDLDAELVVFVDYISTYIESAPALNTGGSGKQCPIPWPMLLASRLMSVYGMSEAQAWDTPCNRAQAYNAAWRWDNIEDNSLLTDDEIATENMVRELIEKEKAANG